MGQVIGDVLPYAVGVAISPVPIIAVILMLFSAKAKSNGPAFVLGWILGLAIAGTIILVLANSGNVGTSSGAGKTAGSLQLVLGLLLLVAAARQWRKRPREGEPSTMPTWMAGIDGFTAGKALVLGAALAAINPKNLALTIGASLAIAQANVSGSQEALALAIFVVLASVTVAGPVIYYLVAGQKAKDALDRGKSWLVANNATVMAVLLLVFGVVLLGKGIAGLSA